MTRALLLTCACLLACDAPDDADGTGDTGDTTAAGTTTTPTEVDPTDDPPTGDDVPPTDVDALTAWLADGGYKGWPSESGPHGSTGPHFGDVRTYVNPALFDSLAAGNDVHPKGAAAVKELYGGGVDVVGYSVAIKGFDNSTMSGTGDGWYWYENYAGSQYGDGFGDGTCVGCHAPSNPDFKDFILTPFPLQ